MTADQAMAEIWGLVAPDGDPDEYEKTVACVRDLIVDSAYEPTQEVIHKRVHNLFVKAQAKANKIKWREFI